MFLMALDVICEALQGTNALKAVCEVDFVEIYTCSVALQQRMERKSPRDIKTLQSGFENIHNRRLPFQEGLTSYFPALIYRLLPPIPQEDTICRPALPA